MPSFLSTTIPEIQDENGQIKEIGQFVIDTYPLGFRGALNKIKGLRKVLYSVPYITGSKPRFKLIVKHISNIGISPFTMAIFQGRDSEPTIIILYPQKFTTGECKIEVETPTMIPLTGQYRYTLSLYSKINASVEPTIVVFKALAQESITLIFFGFLLGLASSLLTWLLTRG